jgi:alkylresorcinol/alkylpyrone synthase
MAGQPGAGLHHFASPSRIARLVARHLRRDVEALCAPHGLSPGSLAFAVVNPSERALAHAIVDHLDLPPAAKVSADAVWSEHGNTLAAGPLLVSRCLADAQTPAAGSVGLLVALGPGLTCDLSLLRWNGALPGEHRDAAATAPA